VHSTSRNINIGLRNRYNTLLPMMGLMFLRLQD